MAQAAIKTCEICTRSRGSHYCMDCRKYFCDNCKSIHKGLPITKNHNFEFESNVIRAVKSKCSDHNEDFVFVCKSCDVPVCMQCITGKHNGHNFAKIGDTISSLKEEVNQAINSKLNEASKTLSDSENGCLTFNININSVVQAITEEGTKLKAMIDRQIEKMINSFKEKANLEKDKLSKVISDAKEVLDKCLDLREKNDQLQKAWKDANMIEKLKALKNESDKVQIPTLIYELPVVKFSNKTVTDKEISQLLGTYNIR